MAAAEGPNDHEAVAKSVKRVGTIKAGSYLAGITFVSVLAGFGFTLARVKKKNPAEFSEVDATRLALKALGLGTALSISGTGLLIVATKWLLQVDSMEEFTSLMQRKMPQKDGDFVKRFESWRIPRKETNDENEWEKAVS